MIKLIVGTKGSGKTKKIVELVNESVQEMKGSVVFIEKSMEYTYNISTAIRVMELNEYSIDSYDKFYGFFCGVLAGNYDIEKIFMDGILRVGNSDLEGFGNLLSKIDELTPNIEVTFTVSAAVETLPLSVSKYL